MRGDLPPRKVVRGVFEQRADDHRFGAGIGITLQIVGRQVDGLGGVGGEDHLVGVGRSMKHACAYFSDFRYEFPLCFGRQAPGTAHCIPDRCESGGAGAVVEIHITRPTRCCRNLRIESDAGRAEFFEEFLTGQPVGFIPVQNIRDSAFFLILHMKQART